MFLNRSEYDRGVNTFSPEGRLFQVEYAMEALGSTAIGVKTSEGVVLAAERRINTTLLEPSSVDKIWEIDAHIGAAMSGFAADASTLIERARVESQNHSFSYDEPIRIERVTQSVCDMALSFGEDDEGGKTMSRPFGVALLIAGVDDLGPQLFTTDPSGTFFNCDAKAIGAANEGASTALVDQYNKSMTLKEGIHLALSVLKQVMEDALSSTNVQLAVITTADKKYNLLSKEELESEMKKL